MTALIWEAGSPHVTGAEPGRGLDGIAERVQQQLCGRVRDLHLSLGGNGIILRGRTGSYYGKQLAQHSVACATAQPIAGNEIVVERDPARGTFRFRERPAAEAAGEMVST